MKLATLAQISEVSVERARLPVVYENAKQALATLDAVDECQAWADKAQALASYARQSQDEELRAMSIRIQARAIKRCGQLLDEIKPGTPGPAPAEIKAGALPQLTRSQAATDAGLSEHQRKTALRVASIPHKVFEAQVEQPRPATVTTLAELGTVRRPVPPPAPVVPARRIAAPSGAFARLHDFAAFCLLNRPEDAAHGDADAVAGARHDARQIAEWLARFDAAMGTSS